MDTDIDITPLPAVGYDLVRGIKEMEGRIEFLDQWATEVKDFIKAAPPHVYDGMEFDGDCTRRLRVRRLPARQQRRFQFSRFVKEHPGLAGRFVRPIAPPHPVTVRLSGVKSTRSQEWAELSRVGATAERKAFPLRDEWQRRSTPAGVAGGLLEITDRMKVWEQRRDELREALLVQALEDGWRVPMAGHGDGRLFLPRARMRYEAVLDRDELMRRYPEYVSVTPVKPTVSVGFYEVTADYDDYE